MLCLYPKTDKEKPHKIACEADLVHFFKCVFKQLVSPHIHVELFLIPKKIFRH